MSTNEDYIRRVLAQKDIEPVVFDLVLTAAQQSSNSEWLRNIYDRHAQLTPEQQHTLFSPASLRRIFPQRPNVVTALTGRADRPDRLRDLFEVFAGTTSDSERRDMANALFAAALDEPFDLELALDIVRIHPAVLAATSDAKIITVLEHIAFEIDVEPEHEHTPAGKLTAGTKRTLGRLTALRKLVMYATFGVATSTDDDAITQRGIILFRQFRRSAWFIPVLAKDPARLTRVMLNILEEDEELVVITMRAVLASSKTSPGPLVESSDPAIAQTAVLQLPWASPVNPQTPSTSWHTQMFAAAADRIGPNPEARELMLRLSNEWTQSGAALVDATLLALAKNERAA